MCARYTLTDPGRLARAFPRLRSAALGAAGVPRYNIAPTQVVLGARDGGRAVIEPLTWGLHGRVNVRAERLTAGGRVGHRCVLFADGFYEWRDRKPVRFTLHSAEPFALAGVWAPVREGPPACAIVTCEPNELVRPVHDRMPAIVPADALDVWLGDDDLPADVARAILQPFAASAMAAQPVSRRVNNARYDAPDVLRDDDPVQQSLGFLDA
jgi:putative SOS response-associated peptidase YedK